MVFIGDDNRRLVIINGIYDLAKLSLVSAHNGNPLWIDEKTGEEFEISENI